MTFNRSGGFGIFFCKRTQCSCWIEAMTEDINLLIFLVLILPYIFYFCKNTFSSQSLKPNVKFHSFRISTLAVH